MGVNQLFSFVVRLILAKLLFPEEFGVVGMATVFIGLVQVLNDLGIGAAIVQRKEENLKEAHYHSAFWTGVIWSVFLYVFICLVISPLASSFYNEPILEKLIPFLSLGILSSPVNLVHKAQLTKAMNFKKMAFVENTSNLVSGVLSIFLAFMGAGVWSLAFNSVASIVVAIPLYFNATKWKPKLIWEKGAFRDVFGFGLYTTGTNVVNYFIGNFDYLIIGKLLSSEALGIYTFAFVLTDMFRSRLMSIINKVMYPVYGKLQTQEENLKKYYLMTVSYNSIIVFPIMIFMIALGEPFIIAVFGDKWKESVDPLAVLALSVMIHMMVNSNTSLIRGMGKPKLELKLQLLKSAIFIPTLFVGIHFYGIMGAAWVVVINKLIAVLIAQYTFNNLLDIKISTLSFLKAVKNPWMAAILAYAAVQLSSIVFDNFFFATFSLLFVYILIIWLLMGKELKQQVAGFLPINREKNTISF